MAQAPRAYCKIILVLVTLFASRLVAEEQPPKIVYMDAKIREKAREDFIGYRFTSIFVGKQKYVLPDSYMKQSSIYYNYKPKPDDVYLSNFPFAGSEWYSDVVWLIVNNLNFSTVKSTPRSERVSWLEQKIINPKDINKIPADSLQSPRTLQTFLPFNLIPEITKSAKKIIYFARNPKDTMLAYYNEAKDPIGVNFNGDINKYWYYFQNDLVVFGPFWTRVKEGFAQRKNKRVLFLYSEEDPLVLIMKISRFLGKKYTDQQLKQIANFLDKVKIKKGTWKGVFSKDLNGKINKWIKENIGDLKFPNIDLYS